MTSATALVDDRNYATVLISKKPVEVRTKSVAVSEEDDMWLDV